MFEEVIQAIGTVGFPIVCCGILFLQNWKQDERHKTESDQFAQAINNNTSAIVKMTTLLETMQNKGGEEN